VQKDKGEQVEDLNVSSLTGHLETIDNFVR
jgi:hypothetical protein